MGYRSDIAIAFAFKTKEQIDEVLAIYQMQEFVQRHDLAKDWRVHDWGGVWGLTFHAESVKWYESYEDVQGYEHMLHVVKTFAEERGVDIGETFEDGKQDIIHLFPYAYYKVRIGEEDNDLESTSVENYYGLNGELYDRMSVRREIETNF